MQGKSHLIIGAATGLVLSQKLNSPPITTIVMTTLGSLIVDLDSESSMINKVLFPVPFKYRKKFKGLVGLTLLLFPSKFLKYLGAIFLLSIFSARIEYRFSFFKGISKYKFHRTIFHDPVIGAFLFALPLYMLNLSDVSTQVFLIGILLHYIADSFTVYGLPLYLFGRKKFHMSITYKSSNLLAEYFIVICFIIIIFSMNLDISAIYI